MARTSIHHSYIAIYRISVACLPIRVLLYFQGAFLDGCASDTSYRRTAKCMVYSHYSISLICGKMSSYSYRCLSVYGVGIHCMWNLVYPEGLTG